MIQDSQVWITAESVKRDDGKENAIDATLEGTDCEGMHTGDFMFYYADIFVEGVQYGNRTTLCDTLSDLQEHEASQQEIFDAMVLFGKNVAGVNP